MARDIKVFKLINGDEIVAEVQEQMNGIGKRYKLIKARQMIVQNTSKGPISGLIPWIMSAPDCEIVLEPDRFFAMGSVSKEVEDHYFEVTSSIALM